MTTKKPPTLVVLQLTGGNDILNTVVPYTDTATTTTASGSGSSRTRSCRSTTSTGSTRAWPPIKPFWDAGKMAIVNGIGYQNPSYSHFRSMDIWYTAEPEKMATDGWLGKVVREIDPKADNVLTAVSFGRGLPRALSLAGVPVASVAELDSYGLLTSLSSVGQRESVLDVFSCMYDDGWNDMGKPTAPPVCRPTAQGRGAALHGPDRPGRAEGRRHPAGRSWTLQSDVVYPNTSIAQEPEGGRAGQVGGARDARLLHPARQLRHPRQRAVRPRQALREVSEAVAAFFADLRAHDEADDVIMLLWSEFGRRVKDNGAGTDHGAGGAAFVIGEPVKGGIYGEYPSLKEDTT